MPPVYTVVSKLHPHLRAWQAPSAFPLLQDEAHLGEELHPIPRFPAEKGQAWDQQTLPRLRTSHQPTRHHSVMATGHPMFLGTDPPGPPLGPGAPTRPRRL